MHLYYVSNGTTGLHLLATGYCEAVEIGEEAFKKDAILGELSDTWWSDITIEYVEEFRWESRVVAWDK